eukprot:8652833-Pyramimonas_sp.AAC.1
MTSKCARHYGENHMLKTARPPSVKLLQFTKRMCTALKREPHSENELSSIRGTLAIVMSKGSRRRKGNHILKINRPPSVTLLQMVIFG